VAAVAALVLAVCVAGLLGFSVSRAGVFRLVLGLIAWFSGLAMNGRRYVSKRMLVALGGFLATALLIFNGTDNTLKTRLNAYWAQFGEPGTRPAPSMKYDIESPSEEMMEQLLEFRFLIYRDTMQMLRHEPPTGVGLGQFPAVFPQYRAVSAIHAKCWHPESNWLHLAAEAGWGTVIVLAVSLGGLFFMAFRAAKNRRGWPLSWATMLAAGMVPVHGLFDVPAYHVGIAWPALVLLLSNFRAGEAPQAASGMISRSLFRGLGLVILAGGISLFANTTGQLGHTPAMLQGAVAANLISNCYSRDMAEKANPSTHLPALKPDGSPVDQMEVGQALVNEALKSDPLDPELHYWRGLLSLNFTDEEPITDQSFAAQRLLEPSWPEVPWRQGLAWLGIDNQRTLTLWQEVLTRAAKANRIKKDVYGSRAWWLQRMKTAASKQPEVLEKLGIGEMGK
jgi:hypothetical protein